MFTQAIENSGADRSKVRSYLASGASVAGVKFDSTGEVQ
jgi:hypothetical protein